jgi:8-oxo-dGTP diphosphatase
MEQPMERQDVAIAVPLRSGTLLLRQRPEPGSLGGTWEFPGGRVEAGEHALDAARRELREETGLAGGRWEPLAVHVHDYPDRLVRLHAFLVREPEGIPVGEPPWSWVPWAELGTLPHPAGNAPLLRALGWRLP